MALRWLITGATGLLAPYLVDACRARGPVVTTARSGGDRPCDLASRASATALVADAAPDVAIHAAALTSVDRCEREPALAFAANRDTVVNLAAALSPTGRLVFISTDQVYPDAPGPHREEAAAPVNVYGRSKLEGEKAAFANPHALVLRTNFFGASRTPGRESLSDFVVRNLSARRPVTLFADISFSPLHMATLAELIAELAERGLAGVFNAGCCEGASKADFALAIARHLGLQTETARVGSSAALASRAPRPHDLRLDVGRLESAIGRRMPTLEQEIGKL